MADSGRAPSGQALAVPAEPVARLGPSGFDPSRDEPAPMPARMRRFLERPPKRLLPETISSRRAKCIRKGQQRSRLDELCEVQCWQCAYCRRNMRRKASPKHPGRHATLDHVVPISRGGKNERGNLVAACDRCNRAKGSGTADEFRAAIAMETAKPPRHEVGSARKGDSAGPKDIAQ